MAEGESLPLAGKRAVVTGASRGIGRSIALAFARAGADIAVTARTGGEIAELAEQIRATGSRSLAVQCDVTDPEQVRRMAAQVLDAMGGVDILVNNAGIAPSHKFVDHPDEMWHQVLATNLNSVYYVCKAFVPSMIE